MHYEDLDPVYEEPMGGIRHVRRIPHPGRGVGGPRTRRSNMHFQSSASNALSGLAPNSRETMDPIAGENKLVNHGPYLRWE